MRIKNSLTPLALAITLISVGVYAQDYDIAILNGRVMDPETGFDKVANVGVKDGKIAVITQQDISADEVIQAQGHVVAPGFIDTHSHSSHIPFGQKLQLRDGVTTPLELEIGVYPVSEYYEKMEGRSQTNFGATVSAAGIREKIVNPEYNSTTGSIVQDVFDAKSHEHSHVTMEVQTFVPNSEQVEQISQMVEQGVKEGALGVGVPVGYMSKGATSKEMLSWQKIAADNGMSTFLHGRFSSQMPDTTGVLGFQEMISSVGIYGGGLLIQHIHQQALNKTPEALEMVADARKAGLKVSAEVYPYYQGATIVGADYLVPENYGPNMGRSYEDIIEVETMKPLTKDRYEALVETDPGTSVIFAGISEEGLNDALADPTTLIASDAMPLTISSTGDMAIDWHTSYEDVQGHPRAAGTHAKVLRLTREKNIMPLMTAVSKMTYMPAKFLEENGVKTMNNKGRMQVNKDADITIFDPAGVQDNSTLTAAGLPSTGIPYVLVNGTVVVKDSKVLEGVYPGLAVKSN
ncbi:amidohydrolase family protein [Alginatibacterium sediminis]|nr:amidohydrolase family protein [Alginatibacterium sediminis]